MSFLTILHKFSKRCFPIPFSPLNSEELQLIHSGNSKVQLAVKNIPFLQKTLTTSYVKKTTLFYAFCVRGCIASHVESDPPGYVSLQMLHQHFGSTIASKSNFVFYKHPVCACKIC